MHCFGNHFKAMYIENSLLKLLHFTAFEKYIIILNLIPSTWFKKIGACVMEDNLLTDN